MGKLIYTDRKNKARVIVCEVVLALLTAVAVMSVITDLFNIKFNISNIASGEIAGGFACFVNSIADTLLINDGIVLKHLSGASENCELFLVLSTVVIAALVYGIIQSGKKWLIFVIPMLALLPMLCTSARQNVFGVLFLLVMTLVSFAYLKSKSSNLVPGIVQVTAIALILLVALGFPVISVFFEKADFASAVKGFTTRNVSNLYYGTAPLGNGELTGDKRNVQNDIALEVSMSNPQATYLRGYVGESYTSDRWSALPYATYKESRNLMFWLDNEDFNGLGQLGQADSLVNDTNTIDIQIEVKDANKKYAYLPYEYSGENESLLNWYDSYITNGNFGRMKSYEFKAYENATGSWTDTAGKLFTSSADEKISEYLKDESWFNEFVYENYTYLSTKEISLMQEYIGDRGDQREGHIEYSTAIKKVRDYLNQNFIYTQDPGLSQDAVMEDFFKNKKGYDTHFATAATFMFRYYGIPARYVEGYLVTPEDVKNAGEDGQMSISQQNVHAWVEIYIDGIGFVPIEVSPEYYDVMPQANLDTGFENSIVRSDFVPENSGGGASTNQVLQNNTSQEESSILQVIKIIVLILLIVLLLAILALLLRKLINSYRRFNFFKKGEPKKAVAAMFEYLETHGLSFDDRAVELGNKAAYSRQSISPEERDFMLFQVKSAKKADRKERLRWKRLK
ncbi:transglutaminase domain-containing protein [Gallibacter intestinalis]|uniref:Transglutaminase domain-containing protein n=1 Tax=Gallibacter intestinalis TaxID=2779356 RepID=A0ABR9QVR7_9FIRM|nr:transglutaminase domain-containing protein [Gallibacter intestinalis]MBE5034963.1 transglutaminase domain-containing protein [Gallibacter intestinalis]